MAIIETPDFQRLTPLAPRCGSHARRGLALLASLTPPSMGAGAGTRFQRLVLFVNHHSLDQLAFGPDVAFLLVASSTLECP